jgi:hypothetical protein
VVNDRPFGKVIEKALDMIGRPATMPEIAKCIQAFMPEVTTGYVHSYAILCGKSLCWTPDGKACLVSWELPGTLSKKPKLRHKTVERSVEFINKIRDAIKGRELSSNEVKKIAIAFFPDMKKGAVVRKIYCCPGLLRVHHGGHLYFKVDPSYSVPTRKLSSATKTGALIKDIEGILKEESKKKRSDLVRILRSKGYSIPLIYQVIRSHPKFSVTVHTRHRATVKLVG